MMVSRVSESDSKVDVSGGAGSDVEVEGEAAGSWDEGRAVVEELDRGGGGPLLLSCPSRPLLLELSTTTKSFVKMAPMPSEMWKVTLEPAGTSGTNGKVTLLEGT